MLSTRGLTLRGFALPVLLLCVPVVAAGQDRPTQKLDRILSVRARQFTGRSRVIVEFVGSPDVRAITGARGVTRRALHNQRGHVAEVNNLQLAALAADPRVARVMSDRPAFATLERTSAAVGLGTLAPRGATGAGIGIAVIDSGVYAAHDDLWRRPAGERVVRFKDFTVPDLRSTWTNAPPHDGFGHGTHVAGILAGNGYNSSGRRRGLAPRAHLVALKVLDDAGVGFVSDVIDALDYAVANKAALGIRVINLSVGSGVYESYTQDPLTQAAKRAVDAGIVVVAAAGNLGQNAEHEAQFGGITSPGNAPWVLTVGAASHQGTARRGDDAVGGFSSRGPTWIDFSAKPDLVAPGVGIESLADPHSLLYTQLQDYLLSGTRQQAYKPYLSLSGTSMAAPVVAATVALMLETNPALTPNAVKAILQYTAEAQPHDSVLVQGAGFLNARGALRLSRFFARPRLGLGAPRDVIEGQTVAWARHLIWGNYRVTGGLPLPGSNAWATSVSWGAARTLNGQPVVWGTLQPNVVWGESGDDNVVWGETSGTAAWSTAGDDNVVWGESDGDNVVWGESGEDNVVWGESGDDNVVWGESTVRNIVWGSDCGGRNCSGVVWGARNSGGAWGTTNGDDNVVWGESGDDNVVWGESGDDNVVWGESLRASQVLWPAPLAIDNRRSRAAKRESEQ
jgi:serine protease AprX